MRLRSLVWLAMLASTLGVRVGMADEVAPQSEVDRMLERLQIQDARIQQLEHQLQRNAQPPQIMTVGQQNTAALDRRIEALEAAYKKAAEEQEEEDDSPEWVDVSGEKWSGKWGGVIMGDYVMYGAQDAANVAAADIGDADNYFEFRRLRFFASGTGWGVYDYKLQVDFEPENGHDVQDGAGNPFTLFAEAVSIKDVWVGINEIPFFGHVRFGNSREPFSLEELTEPENITFLERSLPTALWAPSRHVGINTLNHSAAEDITWATGIFFNDISEEYKERIGDNQSADFAHRVTVNPYYADDGRGVLHLGAGYVYSWDRDERVQFRVRPEVHEDVYFIDTGVLDVADYSRSNLEALAIWGSASLQSEYFFTHTNGINGQPDEDFHGAYIQGSYFLTGENRVYNRKSATIDRVKPFTNFWIVDACDGVDVGWGAWELTSRFSYVDLNTAYLSNPASPGFNGAAGELYNFTLGANWYWNPNTRYMFDWIHAYGDRNDVGRNDADIFAMRLQVDF